MKNKKFIAGIMAIAMVFGSAAVLPDTKIGGKAVISASAEELIDECIYGDWYCPLQRDGGGLVISKYLGNDTEVVVPSELNGLKVTDISYEAFCNRTDITGIVISDGIEWIDEGSFSSCTNLKNISFPNSITYIGAEAFDNTPWLENKLSESPMVIINNFLYDGKECKGDVVIPDYITNINAKAFFGNANIESITIPSSVTEIGYCSIGFIKKEVSDNGSNADASSSTSTDSKADSSSKVDSSPIPSIYEKVSNLKIYCYSGTAGEQYAIENGFDYQLLDESDTAASAGGIDSSLNVSDSSANDVTDFEYSEVTDGVEITDNTISSDMVKIPETINGKNVVSINNWAFAGMEIKSVELPSVLKSIGEYAFFNCPALTSVTIPKNVENIGDYAFGYYLDENAVSGSSTIALAGAMTVDINNIRKVDGFKIYCYTGTAGEKYAVDNGFEYVLLDRSDSDTNTSSISETTSNSSKTNNSSTANPSTGAAAGLALAAVGLGAVVVTKRRK